MKTKREGQQRQITIMGDNLESKEVGKKSSFSNQKEFLKRDIKYSRESDTYKTQAKRI